MSRAPQNEAVATAGESETMADFERLGWGAVVNGRHDNGTDLILWARDLRRFDVGVFVGAQVKTGDSQFDEPVEDANGDVSGWWFRDDDRSHVDDWAQHGSPYLILLHDLVNRVTYWEHVTAERIVSTGIGAKVLVPKANTVDDAHRDALFEIASTARPAIAWEGSVWTGAAQLSPGQLLRHALIVPRLVAPHPNAGRSTVLAPEGAVALLVQGRLSDFERFANEQSQVPTLAEAVGSRSWKWRFVGALGHYLTTGDLDLLLGIRQEAPDPSARSASSVVAVSALVAEGRVDEAIEIVEADVARDDADPVDHAWLQLQLARAYSEVGQVGEARSAAFDVQAVRVTHPNDVTATGLAGFAAELLFLTADWGEKDLANVIMQTDTIASWWRTQTMSHGLEAFEDRTFKGWARDATVTFGGSDDAHNQLFSASLTANNMGDHASWRHLYGLLGEDTLVRLGRDADPEAARSGLETLRVSGEDKSLSLAIKRVLSDGPSESIRLAAATLNLEASTRTTGPTNLTLLEHGGDVLDEATADRSLSWLLATIEDPSFFISRTSPSYLVEHRLVDTLASVVPAASVAGKRTVVAFLAKMGPQPDQLLARSWARVVAAVPEEEWDQEFALQLLAAADGHYEDLKLAVLGVAARFDRSAKSRLMDEARTGSLNALGALGDVRRLDADVVTKQIAELTQGVSRRISDASVGSYGSGGHDVGRALALLCAWHPGLANWESLLALLRHPQVAGFDKRGALGVLSSLVDQIPAPIRQQLEDLVKSNPENARPPTTIFSDDDGDLAGPLAELAAALEILDEDAMATRVLDLLGGNEKRRQWAAQVARRLNRPDYTGVLVALIHDEDPAVRAVAAMGLATLVASGQGGVIAESGLRDSLRDPGVLVPRKIASVLADSSTASDAANDALFTLRTHASAAVRSIALGVDARYAAYQSHPLDEPDEWGDLETFHAAAEKS